MIPYFNFSFRPMSSEKELHLLKTHLLTQTLNYPNYCDWVERAIDEIDQGYKQTILAFRDSSLVGNLIYQSHKSLKGFVEIKNSRISPELSNRHFCKFMFRQAEVISKEQGNLAVICDFHSSRKDIFWMFIGMGYKPVCDSYLYDENTPETIMAKPLTRDLDDSLILNATGKII